MSVAVSPFRHGPDEYGDFYGAGEYRASLERNGVEVGSSSEEAEVFVDVPADAADYKFTLDAKRETGYWLYSTQIHSSWECASPGPRYAGGGASPQRKYLGSFTGDAYTSG